ncbi:MAG: formylglycine-generating enzyme family protein, partial [Campylobacterota bacterium]|nr:formylglycine-generating enzyme family protein [Campylobacterota bacterium]
QRGSWIDIRIFTNITQEIKKAKDRYEASNPQPPQHLSPQKRVEKFFAMASPSAKELAIYCSVLPMTDTIIQKLIELKNIGKGKEAFVEFYFGGLLDSSKSKEGQYYYFYDGVERELRQWIRFEDAKELFWMLDSVIKSSLGVRVGLVDLLYLYPHNSSIKLQPQEQRLAKLLMDILSENGDIYTPLKQELQSTLQATHPPQNHFQMGSDDGHGDEKPLHTVTFDYSFEIAKYPVSFEEYDLFCEDTNREKPSDKGWGRGKRPVIKVSWDDAQAYCEWISKQSGKSYRLPTEAEWEYCARAGTNSKWSFGDDEKELEKYAWYDKNSQNKTHPVGQKEPNPWGIYDMHGNVWEWCEDDWVNNYNDTPRDGSAYRDEKSERKVFRGGSWFYFDYSARSAVRDRDNPAISSSSVGFRLLRTLPF